jgi:hypothetical protein
MKTNNKQQTAVEWFANKIDYLIPFVSDEHAKYFNLLIEQAKRAEKEQIINAWKAGDGKYDKVADKLAEQYYKETYGAGNQ